MSDSRRILNDPVVRVLRDAKSRIADPHRWCRQMAFNQDRVCAVTAVVRACADFMKPYEDIQHESLAAMEAVLPPGYIHVWQYNDARTHAEVLRLFDQAIEKRLGLLLMDSLAELPPCL